MQGKNPIQKIVFKTPEKLPQKHPQEVPRKENVDSGLTHDVEGCWTAGRGSF